MTTALRSALSLIVLSVILSACASDITDPTSQVRVAEKKQVIDNRFKLPLDGEEVTKGPTTKPTKE